MIRYFYFLAAITLFSACEKPQRNIHKMTGVYSVEKIERAYYTNEHLDSTAVQENLGEICLYDNDSEIYNNIYHTMDQQPLAWSVNGLVSDAIGWYTNKYDEIGSVTFFSEKPTSTPFITYTIPRYSGRSKMDWVYIHRDLNGDMDWTETITVKRNKKL